MRRFVWASLVSIALVLGSCADCPSCGDVRPPVPEVMTGTSAFRLCVANVPITVGEPERACAAVSVTYLLPED